MTDQPLRRSRSAFSLRSICDALRSVPNPAARRALPTAKPDPVGYMADDEAASRPSGSRATQAVAPPVAEAAEALTALRASGHTTPRRRDEVNPESPLRFRWMDGSAPTAGEPAPNLRGFSTPNWLDGQGPAAASRDLTEVRQTLTAAAETLKRFEQSGVAHTPLAGSPMKKTPTTSGKTPRAASPAPAKSGMATPKLSRVQVPASEEAVKDIVRNAATTAANLVVMAMSRAGTPGPGEGDEEEPDQVGGVQATTAATAEGASASNAPAPTAQQTASASASNSVVVAPPRGGMARMSTLPDPFPPGGRATTTALPSRFGEPPGGWRGYPTRVELRATTMSADPALYARAPWFSEEAILEVSGILSFWVDSVQNLPGDIPSDAVMTHDWRRRIALPDHALLREEGEPIEQARVRLVLLVCDRLAATVQGYEILPTAWALDTWTPRCNTEYEYCRYLAEVDVDGWPSGGPHVMMRALLMTGASLPEDFRTQTRIGSAFWESIRVERTNRNRYGYLIPHQCREVAIIHPDEMPRRFVRVPLWLPEYEVPQGCLVELPPCVTYVGTYLDSRRDSPYWSAFVTEWCALTAKNLLWDAYDRMYLWYVPPRVADGIEYLANAGALDEVLGSRANVDEAVELVRMSRSQDWDNVPRGNNHRTPPPCARLSPGREEPAGDYVFVEARSRTRLTQAEAQRARARRGDTVAPPRAGPPRSARNRASRSRRRQAPIEWRSDGWTQALGGDDGAGPSDAPRRAKIPRVEEDRDPAPAPRLPSQPGTPAVTSPVGPRGRTQTQSGAVSTQVAKTESAPGTSMAAGGTTRAPAAANATTTEAASATQEVVDLTADDEVKAEPVEVGTKPSSARAEDLNAMIGIAAESMLNAGVSADVIRDTIARMRTRGADGGSGSGA